MKTLSKKLTIFILSVAAILFFLGCTEDSTILDPYATFSPPDWIQGTWVATVGGPINTFTSDNFVYGSTSGSTSFEDSYRESQITETYTATNYLITLLSAEEDYYHFYFEQVDPNRINTVAGDTITHYYESGSTTTANFNKANTNNVIVNLTKQ